MPILVLVLLALVVAQACRSSAPGQEELQAEVETALDAFVAELVAERPTDADAYAARLRAYVKAHSTFFGSAVALLSDSGTVMTSPYVYRSGDGLATLDLALPFTHKSLLTFQIMLLTIAACSSRTRFCGL